VPADGHERRDAGRIRTFDKIDDIKATGSIRQLRVCRSLYMLSSGFARCKAAVAPDRLKNLLVC